MNADPHEIAELPRSDDAPRDGIGEEDNPIPPWWWWTFFGTVVFAAFYFPYYVFSGWSQRTQYAEQVEQAKAVAAASAPAIARREPVPRQRGRDRRRAAGLRDDLRGVPQAGRIRPGRPEPRGSVLEVRPQPTPSCS